MSDKLTNRLRGKYEIGPNGVYGTRSFSDFIPPISIEAADRIDELEAAIKSLTGHNLPTCYDGDDDDAGRCPYCGGWNMKHNPSCEACLAEKVANKDE